MIKITEEFKNHEKLLEFQNFFRESCNGCLEAIFSKLDGLKNRVAAEFINLEEIKEDIKQLLLAKLTIKIPEMFINEIPSLNAEKEPKKRAKKPSKPKSKIKRKPKV